MAADTLLPKQHRAWRIELDPQRDADEQRPQQSQRERRTEKVEQALGHRGAGQARSAARTAATTRPTSESSMRVYSGKLSMRSYARWLCGNIAASRP